MYNPGIKQLAHTPAPSLTQNGRSGCAPRSPGQGLADTTNQVSIVTCCTEYMYTCHHHPPPLLLDTPSLSLSARKAPLLRSLAYQCSPQKAKHKHSLRPPGLHASRSRKRMTATRPFGQFTNNSAKGPGTKGPGPKGPAERPALWRSPARSTDGVHVATAPRARPHRQATCTPTYRRPVTPYRT